jgi:glycerol kinase
MGMTLTLQWCTKQFTWFQVTGAFAPCLSAVPALLLLLQSDILQVPVQRPHFQETTALGAALAAGYTVGFWDMSFLTDHTPDEATTFLPEVTKEVAARRFKHWKKAVGRCLDLADLAT